VTESAQPPLLRPRALHPGDLVVIAALSGPLQAVHEPNVEQTVVVLERMGFRGRRAPLLEAGRHHWWSAATPAEIAAELNALLRDPEVRAIIANDGGQTALGYLDLIDIEAIRADPKPILGYSDISLLHLVLYARTGLVGFHADMATPGFGGNWQTAPATRRAELEHLYTRLLTNTEAIGALPASPTWECWRAGRTEGQLIGGVINRIVLAQATPFALPLESFDGAVLFWEEMGGLASYVWSYLQVRTRRPEPADAGRRPRRPRRPATDIVTARTGGTDPARLSTRTPIEATDVESAASPWRRRQCRYRTDEAT
jgi:muramoyltetrapeptide carboxypeptidase